MDSKLPMAQTKLDFSGGRLRTGPIGTGVEGIERMEPVDLLLYATVKHSNSTRMGFADAADLDDPLKPQCYHFCDVVVENAFRAIYLSGFNAEFRIGPLEREALAAQGIRVEVLRGRAQLATNASRVDVVATCKSLVDQLYPDLDGVLQGHSGKVEISLWIYYSVNFAKKGTTNLAKVVKDMRGTPQPWPTQKNLLA